MEHGQSALRVFVCMCKSADVWTTVRLSLPATAEAMEGHTTTAEHTQSQAQWPLNIKQFPCSWQFILAECSHTRMCLYTHTQKWRPHCTVWLLGYFKRVERIVGGTEWHSNITFSSNLNKMCQHWEYKISEWEFLASDIQRNSISGPSMVPRTSRRAGLCWSVHINLLPLADGECHSVQRCIFKEYRPDNGAIKHIILQSNHLCLQCTWSRSHFQAT